MSALWADWKPPGRDEPILVPIFGCRSFGANTTCDDIHHGPLPEHTRCYCVVCNKTGSKIETRLERRRKADEARAAWLQEQDRKRKDDETRQRRRAGKGRRKGVA